MVILVPVHYWSVKVTNHLKISTENKQALTNHSNYLLKFAFHFCAQLDLLYMYTFLIQQASGFFQESHHQENRQAGTSFTVTKLCQLYIGRA